MTAIFSRPSQRRELTITREALGPDLLSRLQPPLQLIIRDAPPKVAQQSITEASPFGAGSTSPGATIGSEPKTLADRTIAQLLQFANMEADWDGNDAAKLSDAREFIRALAPESAIPRPALHADGHAILFLRGPETYAELEFLGKKRIGFYARRGEHEWSDEIDFDGRTLPHGLSQIGLAI
jgi:hypothetical protein